MATNVLGTYGSLVYGTQPWGWLGETPERALSSAGLGTVSMIGGPVQGRTLVVVGTVGVSPRGARRLLTGLNAIGMVAVNLQAFLAFWEETELIVEGESLADLLITWVEANAADFSFIGAGAAELPARLVYQSEGVFDASSLIDFLRATLSAGDFLPEGAASEAWILASEQNLIVGFDGEALVVFDSFTASALQFEFEGVGELLPEGAITAELVVEMPGEGLVSLGMALTRITELAAPGEASEFLNITFVEPGAADFYIAGVSALSFSVRRVAGADSTLAGSGVWTTDGGEVYNLEMVSDATGGVAWDTAPVGVSLLEVIGTSLEIWEGAGLIEMQFDPIGTGEVQFQGYGVFIYSAIQQNQRMSVVRPETRLVAPQSN